MLPHAVNDNAPDHIACWAAFSGLLDDDAIKEALGKLKKQSSSSASVYDITEFDKFTNPATMNSPNSPVPNAPFNLTVAKVKAPAPPADYVPLDPVAPIKVTFNGKGKGPANAKKRKHGDDDEDNDEEEVDDGSMDDDEDGAC